MELKLIINRFAETEGIDVPINVKTTFDASGMTQMKNAMNQMETSFKKMSGGTAGLALSMKEQLKFMSASPTAAYNSALAGLKASMKVQKEQFNQKIEAGSKPKTTVSKLFDKQERNARVEAGNNAYWDTMYSNISKTNPLIEALGNNLQKSLGASTTSNVTSVVDKMKDLNTATKNTNTALDKTKGSSKNAANGLKGLSSVIRGSVLIQIQALAHVLRRAFSFIEESFTAAGDYVESINLYTMSVGEYAEAGQNWANKISDALYLDTSEIYQYTGQFFNLTRGLGATAEAADLMSRNLTQLSYDMASYLNIDVSVANNKLMSAMSGQTKAVTSVGIAVQAASLQELAYSLGIEKSVTEMTQAEKTYLRYIQIMRSTTQMQGDLGRTIITPTNAMRLLRTQLNLLSRAIGQVFTPIIMSTLPAIIAFTQVLTELAQTLANMLGYKLSDYLAPASSVKALSDGFGELEDSAKAAGDSISRTLAPFDDLNVVEMSSKGKGSGDDGDSVLSDLEQYLTGYDMLEFYTENMKNKIEDMKKTIKGLLPVVAAIGAAFATWKIFKGTMKFLSLFAEGGTVTKGMSVLTKVAGKLGLSLGALSAVVAAIVATTVVGIKSANIIKDMFKNLTERNISLGESFDKLKLGDKILLIYSFIAPISRVINVITILKQGIKELEEGKSITDVLSGWFPRTAEVLNKFKKAFSDTFGGIINTFTSTFGGVANWVNEKVIQPTWEIVTGLFNGIFLTIKKIGEIIYTIGQIVFAVGSEVFRQVGGFINSIVDLVRPIVDTIYNVLKPIVSTVYDKIILPVTGFFTGMIENIVGAFNGIANTVAEGFNFAFKTVLNTAFSVIEAPINLFIDALNVVIDVIKKIPGTGKIKKLEKLSIPRFEEGGFPQEGEFFMARENGPELVGRIGNRTAVANNDQITTAMTNAMVVALSGMNFNNQPGTTVVNIGGKKVFEGMGDYIDSENDRYGTNYVNV